MCEIVQQTLDFIFLYCSVLGFLSPFCGTRKRENNYRPICLNGWRLFIFNLLYWFLARLVKVTWKNLLMMSLSHPLIFIRSWYSFKELMGLEPPSNCFIYGISNCRGWLWLLSELWTAISWCQMGRCHVWVDNYSVGSSILLGLTSLIAFEHYKSL